MNDRQIQKVTAIQRHNFNEHMTDEKYEVKRFVLSEVGNKVFVCVAWGVRNDVGTYAELYCRKYGHFVVGPRGGVTALTVDEGRKTNAKKYPLIYGWRSR